MTTKTISGTYSAGYFLSTSFNTVVVTKTGSVGGFGLVTTGAAQIQNYGHLQSTGGADAVYMTASGDNLTNHAGGYIRGAQAIIASGGGSNGNNGGAGAYGRASGTISLLSGDAVGGAGGAGVAGTFGGDGGFGGNGATLHAGGYVKNAGGYLFGGSGGAGGASSNGGGARGGTGGAGGSGVQLSGYGDVANFSGGIAGGYGGQGGGGIGTGGYGGGGGAAAYLGAGGIVLVEGGFLEGGRGGVGVGSCAGGFGGDGVELASGGYVVNHQLIVGGQGGTGADGENQSGQQLGSGGAGVFSRGGIVENYALISGGAGGGTPANPGSRPGNGGSGVEAVDGLVLNYGTIDGGGGGYSKTLKSFCGYGVDMAGTGSITNGSASVRTAVIQGNGGHYSEGPNYNGVGVFGVNGSVVTVTNWGALAGTDAVLFNSSGDTLLAESGSVLTGFVLGGGGTIELGAGSGTVSGIDANGNVTVTGFLGSTSNTLMQNFGSLEIAAGGSFAMAAGATIASGKTLIDNGVVTEASGLTVAGTIGGAGTLAVTGKLTFQNKSALSVADTFVEAKAAKVMVNTNLVYAGFWDQSSGSLTVSAGRTLDFTGATEYLQAKTLTNNGDLEMSGTGHLEINTPLTNNGALVANGGTIVLENVAAVTGSGEALINGGTLVVAGAFSQTVGFEGTGDLILDHSQSYTGTISGFSQVGTTFLDLGDIGFVSTGEAVFSGNSSGGVLTVSDGTHTAHINLSGNYTASTFVCVSDGHGGVIIHDPTQGAGAPPIQTHALVAALASMAPGEAAQSGHSAIVSAQTHPVLLAPHAAMA